MHEAKRRLGSDACDQPHLGDRSDVEVRDTTFPQQLDQLWGGVRFDRIELPAHKLLHEEAGGTPRGMRAKERYRLDRTLTGDFKAVRSLDGAGS
jgi:hypothetical protein